MPFKRPIWNNTGSFNSQASPFMSQAMNAFNRATDGSIYKENSKKSFEMYQAGKKEEFDKQTGDVIGQILNGQNPQVANGNFDHKAVAYAIKQKKEWDYKQARDIISDDRASKKMKMDFDYKQSMLDYKGKNLDESIRHNQRVENIDITKVNNDAKYKGALINQNDARISESIRHNRVSEYQKQNNYKLNRDTLDYNKGVRQDKLVSDIALGKYIPPELNKYGKDYIPKKVITHKAGSYTKEGKKTLDKVHEAEKKRNMFLKLPKDKQIKMAEDYWKKIANDPTLSKAKKDYAVKTLGEKNLWEKTIDGVKSGTVSSLEFVSSLAVSGASSFRKSSTTKESEQRLKQEFKIIRKRLGISDSPTGNAVKEFVMQTMETPLKMLDTQAEQQKYYENTYDVLRVPTSRIEKATTALQEAMNSKASPDTIRKLQAYLYSQKQLVTNLAIKEAQRISEENRKKKNKIYELNNKTKARKDIIKYKENLKKNKD